MFLQISENVVHAACTISDILIHVQNIKLYIQNYTLLGILFEVLRIIFVVFDWKLHQNRLHLL